MGPGVAVEEEVRSSLGGWGGAFGWVGTTGCWVGAMDGLGRRVGYLSKSMGRWVGWRGLGRVVDWVE